MYICFFDLCDVNCGLNSSVVLNTDVCLSVVPLKNISVDLQVQDHIVSVSSSLQYVNEEDSPLEAVFVFPLPADAAVCHFSAKIGEQEIVAEVQEKQSVSPNTESQFIKQYCTVSQSPYNLN